VGQLPNSLFLALFTRTLEQRESRSFSRQLRDQFPRGLPQNHDLLYTLEDFVDWWLTTQPTLPEPWMSYLHVMPPHDPYYPRVDFIGRFAEQPVTVPIKPEHYFSEGRDQAFLEGKREQYDEFIAYADAEFGRLIDGMRASGTLENTIVVVTADHGEMFERGIYRHITPALYEPIVRIPLVMRVPGNNERVDIHSPSSSVDLLQTLGHLIDAGLPGWGVGQLLPPWNGSPGNRSLYMMDAKSNSKFGPLVKGTFAMRLENYKVINYIGYDGFDDITEVYDLENDPEELANLWGKGSFGTDLLSILKAEIDAHSRPIEN
jgi:arylsulfatase A-like enzyme